MDKTLINYQFIKIDKNFQYEVCVHYKLKNINGFQFYIESRNLTQGFYESSYSKKYSGTNDYWNKVCHLTNIFKKPNNDSDRYFVGFYTQSQKESGEIFIDDISVKRINFRIGINNDRDEAFDNINVTYQINGNLEYYNLIILY